ncbi:MAG: replication-relaxation family protein [Chloroflexi bacterium]|nr:replication-relaxation family protein [Chloroflexota bacterium]
MATDGDEKRLLDWIGRWPLLTAPQLAGLAGIPEVAVERRIERLLGLSVVRADGHAAPGETPEARLLLAPPGLRLLARREGVPPARYARFAGVSAPGEGPPSGTVRHRSHLLGVNRVMARLAADARAAGGRLAACRNEAQSARRFRHDGRAAWIRPDGSGVLALPGGLVPFLLEYDRGTLDSGDFAAKFGGYGRYYAARAWRRDWSAEPVLLFVCADDRAEQRVGRAVWRGGPRCDVRVPLLLTSEWRFAERRPVPAGLLGPVWWSPSARADDPEHRTALVLRSRGPGRSHDNDLSEGRHAHD